MAKPGKRVAFDARGYWEERLRAHPGISGVGFLGLAPRAVELQYRRRADQLEADLRRCGVANLQGQRVLDIGSGTGIWLDFWHRHGASCVVGMDFTQVSVDQLRQRFPTDRILQADVGASSLPLPPGERFDVISAMSVLLHVVDPGSFRRAIANLARHCAPGGCLIICDAIVHARGYVPDWSADPHIAVRSVDEWQRELVANGFTVESIAPATVLLNAPLEAPSRLAYRALLTWWWIWWNTSSRVERVPVLASLISGMVLRIDQLACRLCSRDNSPTEKFIVARKCD
jgi:SAM-dependent methyltransferase